MKGKKNIIDKVTKIATPIGVFATLIMVILAYIQFRGSNNATKADFTHKFKIDFFTSQTRDLIILLDNDLLKFEILTDTIHGIEFAYFTIDSSRLKVFSKNSLNIFNKTIYTSYEIDDYLLNPLDDIGLYEKRGLLDINYVDNSFDYYIECVHDSKQIKEYLNWIRSEKGFEDSFVNFEYIFQKLKLYELKKHSH